MHVLLILLGEANPGAANERTQLLLQAAREKNIPIMNLSDWSQADCAEMSKFLPCVPVLCGRANAEKVSRVVAFVRQAGATPVLPLDAVDIADEQPGTENLSARFSDLGVHVAMTDGVMYLFQQTGRYVYAYPKPDVSASVVLMLEPDARVVLVRRAEEPFAGMYAIPGGFLRPLAETLTMCARREFEEETGVCLPLNKLELLSVQSDPLRDPRGHVINHTYLAILNDRRALRFTAGDDAKSVEVVPLARALNLRLAADHSEILRVAAQSYFRRRGSVLQIVENAIWSLASDVRNWPGRARPASSAAPSSLSH